MIDSFNIKGEDERFISFKQKIVEMYANFFAKEQTDIADLEVNAAWNFGQEIY